MLMDEIEELQVNTASPILSGEHPALEEPPKPRGHSVCERWLPYMPGLKPDLALREKALFKQQCERWAPYLNGNTDWKEEKKWWPSDYIGNVLYVTSLVYASILCRFAFKKIFT